MSQTFSDFFKRIDVFCLSNDIPGPFNEIYQNYYPNEWYLFIDLSKYSLEVVLYHKGNVKPCMPIDHSVNSKRTNKNDKIYTVQLENMSRSKSYYCIIYIILNTLVKYINRVNFCY